MGLYELQKNREYREDWIFIVDTTVELGPAKCLVIVGISQEKFTQITEEEKRSLQHQDVEVLALEVTNHCTGKLVEEKLIELSQRLGTPKQIVADRGSDIKKGIKLYQEKQPEVIYTYDVTHQMAKLLEDELSEDKRFQSFIQQCQTTRQQIQQTELVFLNCPTPRAKARYHQLDQGINWAINILEYEKKNDFSQISTKFVLDEEGLVELLDKLEVKTLKKLLKMDKTISLNQSEFLEKITAKFGEKMVKSQGMIIAQAADRGRKRFQEKLGWLKEYQTDLVIYKQMLDLIKVVFKQLKEKGLNRESINEFIKTVKPLPLTKRSNNLKNKIIEYLESETRRIPSGETFLGTSDILESLLGKYKIFSSKSPIKEVGKMLLTIPLCTIQITAATVKEALEKIRMQDLNNWSVEVFGQSMLSKKRAISPLSNEHKSCGIFLE